MKHTLYNTKIFKKKHSKTIKQTCRNESRKNVNKRVSTFTAIEYTVGIQNNRTWKATSDLFHSKFL